jgi:hypothetical protein
MNKYFLETSVARSMLTGSSLYRHYFEQQFADGRQYTSQFVQMEITRSFVSHIIDFYFTLHMDSVETVGDALALWSDKFKTSETKAIIQLVGQKMAANAFSEFSGRDKEKALSVLYRYICRFNLIRVRLAKNTGIDSTGCERAKIMLAPNASNPSEALDGFIRAFDDVVACRNRCHVDAYLLHRHKHDVEAMVNSASTLQNNRENSGFIRIADELTEVLDGGANKCSCKKCEKIGDAIITMDTPQEMQLEHTDHAFDYTCPVVGLSHRKHPSQTAVHREANISRTI